MSQMTWTYIADDGSRHKVGLFHGDNTGHLLVYCNARIVIIDFSVIASKNYSFYINEELCDLTIEENEGKFSYSFKPDQITDTPYNRRRKEYLRAEQKQVLLFGLALVLAIILVVYFFFRFNS